MKRIEWLYEIIDSDKIKALAKKKPQDFTRNRKLNISGHIKLLLNKKGQSLTMELKSQGVKMSKQGYSKAREKINPEVFKELNKEYVRKLYETKEIIKYNGYILLGVDGTTNELPNCNELKEYYGVSKGQENSVGRVRAKVEGIYDCLNKIMIAAEINKYEKSEKELAINLIKKEKEIIPEEKTIMIFDRYYFGIEFAHIMNKLEQKYIMRIRDTHYKKEKEEAGEDKEVEIKIRTNSIFYADEINKEELKKLKKIKIRIIKVELEKEIEYLATNLSEEELPKEEAGKIYYKRWNIEKSYDVIKNKIQIENYSSRTVNGIENEFYAGILVHNIIEDIASEAEENKTRKGKYEYKVNKNILVGIYRQEMIKVLEIEEDEERKEAYIKMMNEMAKNVVEIKPGRQYQRRKMHSMNKYRHNLRRNS